MELYYIWLECIYGLGPVAWHNLLHEYGNPKEIFLNRSVLEPSGHITDHQLEVLNSGAENALEHAKKILEDCKRLDITILKYSDLEYGENIRKYIDFPILFYVKGNLNENWTHGTGIVGARRCSKEGKACAIETALQAVHQGLPVISGMAKGVDSYAHTAAINQDGYTVAVLGYGIDMCYPVEHMELKKKIAEKGLLISEYPPGTLPRQFYFPKRNRIIAGLSDIIYVIDTTKNSGTETTVKAARKYGKKIGYK